jgi:hypothetical protein
MLASFSARKLALYEKVPDCDQLVGEKRTHQS